VLPRIEARAHGPRASPGSVWAAVRPLLKGSPAAAREALRSELRALDQGPNGTGVAVHGRPLGRWLHRAFPDRCRMPLATRPLVVDPALLPSAAHAAGRFVAVGADDVKGIKSHLEARWGTDRTGGNPASFAWRSHWTLQEEFVLLSGLLRARRKLRDPDDDDNDDDDDDKQEEQQKRRALPHTKCETSAAPRSLARGRSRGQNDTLLAPMLGPSGGSGLEDGSNLGGALELDPAQHCGRSTGMPSRPERRCVRRRLLPQLLRCNSGRAVGVLAGVEAGSRSLGGGEASLW